MESRARTMLTIADFASKLGQLRRQLSSASPSMKVILQIQITTLENAISNEARGLRQKEWRVC